MARIYLAIISVMICAADALLLRFVFSNHNPWNFVIGVLIGQIGSTPFLIAAIYRRLNWARYVLITLLFFVVGIFALVALDLNSRQEFRDRTEIAVLLIAAGLLALANTWLIRSKRIQHLARMGESSGA